MEQKVVDNLGVIHNFLEKLLNTSVGGIEMHSFNFYSTPPALRPSHYFLIGNRLRFHSFVLTKDYFKFGTFLIFGTGFETWDIF